MRALAPPTGKCSARGVMRVRKGLLERDLWAQISVLFFSSLLLLRVLARGGCPEKIAALRAGELRILARGAALKKIAALRAREFVRALRMSL